MMASNLWTFLPTMKKRTLTALALASPAAAFAQGSSTDYSTAIGELGTAATGVVSSLLDPVSDVLVAVFGIVAIFAAFRYIRRAIGR